jgi:hypothetical protein
MVKVGDKFIIEIDEIFENSGLPFGEKLYRAKGFKSLVFDDIGIRKLTSYAEDQGNNVYNYRDGEIVYGKGDVVLVAPTWERGIILEVYKGYRGRRTYVVLTSKNDAVERLSEGLQGTGYKFAELPKMMDRIRNLRLENMEEEPEDDWMEDQI